MIGPLKNENGTVADTTSFKTDAQLHCSIQHYLNEVHSLVDRSRSYGGHDHGKIGFVADRSDERPVSTVYPALKDGEREKERERERER